MEPEIHQEAIQTTVNMEIPQLQTVMQGEIPQITTIIDAPFVEVTSVNGMTGDVVVEIQMQDFETNHFYKKNTAVTYQGAMYIAKADFTSTSTFNPLDWITPDFVQEQADWAETDTTSDSYIKNKPQNLVQDANYVHTDTNFTQNEKTKLGGISAGAEANVQSDWNEADSSSDAFINNKPTILTPSNFIQGENITLTKSGNDITFSRGLDVYTQNLAYAFGTSTGSFTSYSNLETAYDNGKPVLIVWQDLLATPTSITKDSANGQILCTIETQGDRYLVVFNDNNTFTSAKLTAFVKDYMLDEGQIGRMSYLGSIDPSSILTGTDSTADSAYRLQVREYFTRSDGSLWDKVKIRFSVYATASSGTSGYLRIGGNAANTALRQAIILAPSDAAPQARTGEMPNLFFRFTTGDTINQLELDLTPMVVTNGVLERIGVTSAITPAAAIAGYQMLSYGSRVTLLSNGTTGVWLSDDLSSLSGGTIKVYGIKYANEN